MSTMTVTESDSVKVHDQRLVGDRPASAAGSAPPTAHKVTSTRSMRIKEASCYATLFIAGSFCCSG